VNLKAVKIQGNLGQIMAGDGSGKTALKSLQVAGNLGGLGGATQLSRIFGKLSKLKVGGSIQKDSVQIDGKVKTVLINGDLAGLDSLSPDSLSEIAAFGLADFAATRGGAIPSGVFSAEGIGVLKVFGGVKGGAIATGKDLGFASILGDFSGGIMAGGNVKKIQINGSLQSEAVEPPSTITARNKIDSLVIHGDVENARILVGYDRNEIPVNAGARVGNMVVDGSWAASSLAVGVVDSTEDGFGRNDQIIDDTSSAGIVSKIASLTINGTAIGSALPGDHFGITAGKIGKITIRGSRVPLSNGTVDDIEIDAGNHDFRVVEIG
jgi:hypothetical protein